MDNEKPEGAFRARLKQMFRWLAMAIWHVSLWFWMTMIALLVVAFATDGSMSFGARFLIVFVGGLYIFGIYHWAILHDAGKLETLEQLGLAIKPNYLNGAGRGAILGLVLFSLYTLAAILNGSAVFKPNFPALLIFVIGGACFGVVAFSRVPPSE